MWETDRAVFSIIMYLYYKTVNTLKRVHNAQYCIINTRFYDSMDGVVTRY